MGRDDIFEALYRDYYARVLRYVRAMRISDEDARDVTQETFVRVYNNIDYYRGEARWSYLKTTATRVLLNYWRSRHAAKRSGTAIEIDDVDGPGFAIVESLVASSDPGEDLLRAETTQQQRARLEAAIAELPRDAQEATRLWLTGLKRDEIASVLNLSGDAVRRHLRVVRRRLARWSSDTVSVDALLARTGVSLEPVSVAPLSEPRLIFEPAPPALHIPKMIVSVEEALIETIKREPQAIFSISSRAFEELLAGIFKTRGFETELTKATRDGGRDIVAVHEVLGIRSKYIIECKRYAAHRKVSLQLVQRLYGVKTAENANKAILATTSSFTRDARTFASHHVWDLELKAFDDIMAWIREYPN